MDRFGNLFMCSHGRAAQPHCMKAGPWKPVAITGHTRQMDTLQLALDVNRKCFFKHHNHVLSSNYRMRHRPKHVLVMGQRIDHHEYRCNRMGIPIVPNLVNYVAH